MTTRKKTTPKKKKPSISKSISPERAFLKAMLAFQSEVPELKKTATAYDKQGRVYHYTPLPIMRKLLQPFLTKHEFVYAWDFREETGKIVCICGLTHIDGFTRTATMTAEKDNTVDMNNIQAVGSTMTYLQRYSFKAVLGLTSADEDNDGSTSTSSPKTTSAIPEPQAISKEREQLEQMELEELVIKVEREIVDKWMKEKFGEKTYFSEKEKAEIKKFLIDTILSVKRS